MIVWGQVLLLVWEPILVKFLGDYWSLVVWVLLDPVLGLVQYSSLVTVELVGLSDFGSNSMGLEDELAQA